MKIWFCALCVSLLTGSCSVKSDRESISGNDSTYRAICTKATTDPLYFQHFRSLADYAHIVEIGGGGEVFIDFLRKNATTDVLIKFKDFERLDWIGNPFTIHYPGIGKFSTTTLRYIAIAVQMKQLFSLPKDAKIVEIGGGFGGQCFILSQLQPFAGYYIFDLPEVEVLIGQVIHALQIPHATCASLQNGLLEDDIDLLISNYAFSECEKKTQLDYFEKVIKKSKRGYIIYNQIAQGNGLDYLSPDEFISLLKQNGLDPKIYKEPVVTDANNILIVWGERR